MNVIEYKNVSKSYGDYQVIEDFNLSVEKGAFLTIIGSSGCGKTTTLKMVNGLIMPTTGEVLVDGQPTREADLIKLRRSIGYCIQGNVLFPNMTVEKNIAYVPNLAKHPDKKKIREIVNLWMERVGLERDLKKRYPRQLSGGQQQRVGIARALAASPSILLMDEPFGAVDKITRNALQEEIKKIQKEQNITTMFVTHDIEEAFKLGDKILVLEKGKIQQFAAPEIIKEHPANDFVAKLVSDYCVCKFH